VDGDGVLTMAFPYTLPSLTVGASFGRSKNVIPPNDWRPTRSYPLIMALHPYGGQGTSVLTSFGFDRGHNFDDGCIIFAPDGVLDGASRHWRYWDTSTGLDFDYLTSCVAEIEGRFNISWKGVAGYSNGAFMAQQLVIQYPTLFHTLVMFAGAGGVNDTTSQQSVPTPALYVIGDADATVLPAGDPAAATLPGALAGHGGVGSTGYKSAGDTVTGAALRNGVSGSLGSAGTAFDLSTGGTPSGAGAECTAQIYSNTTNQTAVELWTEAAAGHSSVATLASFRGSYPVFKWMMDNHRTP